jgi:hypothetical protein
MTAFLICMCNDLALGKEVIAMTKHLYFSVRLQDAVHFIRVLTSHGITRYHLEPHDEHVAFVFRSVSAVRYTMLRHVFGADGKSRQSR